MGIQKYQRNQHHVRFADTSRIDLISSRLIFVFVENLASEISILIFN